MKSLRKTSVLLTLAAAALVYQAELNAETAPKKNTSAKSEKKEQLAQVTKEKSPIESKKTRAVSDVASTQKGIIAVVTFKECVEKSKLGKREQAAFENMKKQMDQVLEKKEKELNELAAKFNDPDYLDSLSQEAEAELKHKLRNAGQELSAQQNQYYQALSQANVKVLQMITQVVEKACAEVAKQKGFEFILNDEACYFSSPDANITDLVVAEMDRMFEAQTAPSNSAR